MSGSQSRGLFATALLLIAIGWAGLILLVATTLPTLGPRWLFFFLLAIAVTGTALPFVWVLHKRFGAAPTSVLLRQALWVALYISLLVWLQFNRSLTLSLSLLLAVGFILLEWFLGLVERSVWRPDR